MPTDESASPPRSLASRIQSHWLALAIGLGAGSLIWAASSRITGAEEPWDADGFYALYYVGALALTGFGLGLLGPRRGSVGHLVVVYAGVFVGQLAYAIAFLPGGPLWVLGVMFLAQFSVIAVFAAAIAAYFRR
jgi:hypothetical protein